MKLLFFLFLLPTSAHASFIYWQFGQDVGSSWYWLNGTGPGSEYYWKFGIREGSRDFWRFGTRYGSKYYWENGREPGSAYYWKYGRDAGSAYYWESGRGPGSKYFWETGEIASYGPIWTALCKSGELDLPPCRLMVDNPLLQRAEATGTCEMPPLAPSPRLPENGKIGVLDSVLSSGEGKQMSSRPRPSPPSNSQPQNSSVP